MLGASKGTIINGNVRLAASPLGSEVYLFATGGTSSTEYATANKLCSGSDKWVNLNAGDAARINCIGSTLYVYGESGSTEVIRPMALPATAPGSAVTATTITPVTRSIAVGGHGLAAP